MARFRDRSHRSRRRGKGGMLRYVLALLLLLLVVVWIWTFDLESSGFLSWMTQTAPARSALVSDHFFEQGYSGGYSSALGHPLWTSFEIDDGDIDSIEFATTNRLATDRISDSLPGPPQGFKWMSIVPSALIPADSLVAPVAYYCVPPAFEAAWRELIAQSVQWAAEYGTLEAVAGIVPPEADERSEWQCPDSLFYALLLTDGDAYHSVGFVIPIDIENTPLLLYMRTVNEIEAATGIDLYGDMLGDEWEEQVESMQDRFFWQYRDSIYQQRLEEYKTWTNGQ